MSYNFSSNLSDDYLTVLENEKYSDVIIKVGEGEKCRDYKAHKLILSIRSTFFEKEIQEQYNRNTIVLKYENFDSQAFGYILRYLYGGTFNLESKDINFILNMLIITDVINFTNLVEVLQKYLIEKRKNQLNNQFSLVHQVSSKHQSFKKLHTHCDKTCQFTPEVVFKSIDFVNLHIDVLIYLLENKKLRLYEIQKWDYILRWGLVQTPSIPFTISDDPSSSYDTSLWLREHFRDLSNNTKSMIKLIDLKRISRKEFCDKVKPFKKILEKHHYDELLSHHLSVEELNVVTPLSYVAKTLFRF
ncbi:3961_t:CDS:2 [Funneliformis geosporum]|uniref:12582_t:CDS:1 n=1 Tax=Funneliformis geosporum TaxID=1117311 RepID=A0A9W4WSA6_9GLOM|nr:3961_t:CDS:2 [Funneliformis geosporum]CAI2183097.1 12582_t:CDS:2 [Funneliformis geosporum]